MIKRISFLLFSVIGIACAEDGSFVDNATIEFYDHVVKGAISQAQGESKEKLTGTVPELYLELSQLGCKKFIEQHPEMVEEARDLLLAFGDTERYYGDAQDALDEAKRARNEALLLSLSDEATREQRLEAWSNELNLFIEALVKLLSSRGLEGFVPNERLKDHILNNNEKQFEQEHRILIGAGPIVVLKGFDQRRKAMGEDLFNELVKNSLGSSS